MCSAKLHLILAKRPRSDTDSWLRMLPVQLVSLLHVVVRFPRPLAVCAACLRAWSLAGRVAKQHCSLEAYRASARCVPRDIGQTERTWGSGDGKTQIKSQIAREFFRLQPYHREYTSSRPITEVKPGRAGLRLGWVTAWEYPVL